MRSLLHVSCLSAQRAVSSCGPPLSPRPITTLDLNGLAMEEAAAWLAGFIIGDGSVCYCSKPKDGKRCFEARVRIGIFEAEPIEKAAKLMGVKAFVTRRGRHEADASGTRAISVISRIPPHLVGRKTREAAFILEHGPRVSLDVYLRFQALFWNGRRRQAALATPRDWVAISKANEGAALTMPCSDASGLRWKSNSAECSPVSCKRDREHSGLHFSSPLSAVWTSCLCS